MRAQVEGDFIFPPTPDINARGPDITASWVTPENLDHDHLSMFKKAISNILNTELAELVYAEIIDGVPTTESFVEFHEFDPAYEEHPSYNHDNISEGAVDLARQFRSLLDPLSLRFDAHILQSFQNELVGSPASILRLVELVAVSIHQIAVQLYETNESARKVEYETWWKSWQARHEVMTGRDRAYIHSFLPVPFYHQAYRRFDQYPRGKDDLVGYWAEAKIFGGTVLFDRGDTDLECNKVFLHGSLRRGARTIYPLLDSQWDALTGFLLADPEDKDRPECPLPLFATSANRPRYTVYFAVKYQHIFRDRYAYKLPERFKNSQLGCTISKDSIDYPEVEDETWIQLRRYESAMGQPIDESEMERRWARLMADSQPGGPCISLPWPEEIVRGEGYDVGIERTNTHP